MATGSEHPLLGVLQKISVQLAVVVARLESVEQLLTSPGRTAGEEFDEARARIARERQEATQDQERAIDAAQRTVSDLASDH